MKVDQVKISKLKKFFIWLTADKGDYEDLSKSFYHERPEPTTKPPTSR